MKKWNVCAIPGCGNRIWEKSVSCMCGEHMHNPEHCQCRQCKKARGPEPKGGKKPSHPDRITVEVACGGGAIAQGTAFVTLRRAPWQAVVGHDG